MKKWHIIHGKMSIERNDTYKTFCGFKYHLDFPDDWILNEKPDTGRQCWNCVGKPDQHDGFAMWRGIVLGYCANCVEDYEGERGKGFIGFGVENMENRYPSVFDLYLGVVDFENFGDLADNEEDTMENRQDFIEETEIQRVQEERWEDEEEDESEDHYYGEDDDFGECLHIGCGKAHLSYSPYCRHHFEMYDNKDI